MGEAFFRVFMRCLISDGTWMTAFFLCCRTALMLTERGSRYATAILGEVLSFLDVVHKEPQEHTPHINLLPYVI
jgi:hypothetical protein